MSKRGRKTKKPQVKAKDDKGYLDSNKNAFTDYKVIRGNKITMEGVSGKVYAIPVDKQGKAGKGRLMKAGENHTFDGASHVIEVPEVHMAQLGVDTGGFNQQRMEQLGIKTMLPINEPTGAITPEQPEQPDYLSMSQDEFRNSLNTSSQIVQPAVEAEPAQREAVTALDLTGLKSQVKGKPTAEELLQESASNATDELEQRYAAENRENPEGNEIEETQKIQFDNPYGGVDIPTAAQTLGASLSYDGDKKGANTARGVASGLKLLTGLGRNVMSGYAQNKRNQWALDEYNDNQKGVMRQTQNLQGGGSVSPSEGAGVPPQHNASKKRKDNGVSAAELLAGHVMTGDPTVEPNVNVESGEHIKDNQTGQVQEVVGDKHTQGGEDMNLPDHKVLSDHTKIGGDLAKKYNDEFDVKVKAKDTYSTVMDKVLKKTGYKSITDELTATIEKTQKEQQKAKDRDNEATTGINMQFLSGKINDLTKELEPLESLKSNVFETLFADQQGSKSSKELQEEAPEMQDGGGTQEMSRERFRSWVNNLRAAGFEGDVNTNAENLGAEAAKVQKWMRENKPEAVVDYFTKNNQPITAKGVDMIKETNPELFERAGLDSNKPSASYTDEEKKTLAALMEEDGTYTDDFILEQFNDDKFLFRAPLVNTPIEGGKIIPSEGMSIEAQLMQNPNAVKDLVTNPNVDKTNTRDKKEGENTGTGNSTLLLPDQHILPPSAMQPHRLSEITPREAEAKLISPNAQVEEINRQAMTARAEINNLPDSQRRAALAQLNAQTQQSINQVMSQTNRANAQIEGQNEERNIQRGTQADIFNEQAADVYEKKQLTALDNTEQDIRNYFNAQNKKQVANYNTVQNLNLTNAMYDNFQYDGNGRVIQTGKAPSAEDLMQTYGLTETDLAAAQQRKEELEKEAKKKKTATAKRGRKTK